MLRWGVATSERRFHFEGRDMSRPDGRAVEAEYCGEERVIDLLVARISYYYKYGWIFPKKRASTKVTASNGRGYRMCSK